MLIGGDMKKLFFYLIIFLFLLNSSNSFISQKDFNILFTMTFLAGEGTGLAIPPIWRFLKRMQK